VFVHVEVKNDAVDLRVRDDGSGMAPGALQRIFEAFVQLDGEARGRLGLGLSVVRELVRLHGGTVEAISEGIGKGSEFRVTLPLCEPPESPP